MFVYFWLHWVLVAAVDSLASKQGLLIVVASLAAEQGLCWVGSRGPALQVLELGSVVVAHGLSCSGACGILCTRDQTCVSCIVRHAPSHCTTGDVLGVRLEPQDQM